jgi:AAA domain
MTRPFAPIDFPQKLRQMRPIKSLEDLQAAAFDAVAQGVDRWVAVDSIHDMAIASGLVARHGEDAVQACMGAAFGSIPLQANGASIAPASDSDELDARALAQSSTLPRVKAVDLDRFLSMAIPPRAMMLEPWLPMQGLAMIYAPRGTGKTRMAHGVVHAVATGTGFLRWTAPQPRRVLLLDGEMPATTLQEMLRATVQAGQCKLADPSFFKIAAADLVRDGLRRPGRGRQLEHPLPEPERKRR